MKAKVAKKNGRPPEPVPQNHADAIIIWIAQGKTLREYCRQPNTPCWVTVYNWLEKDSIFAARFAHARDSGADAIAEETLEIIDTFPMQTDGDSGSRLDSAHVAWMKNRVELRMKLLAKWNPRKYGDKLDLNHKGELQVSVYTGVPPADG